MTTASAHTVDPILLENRLLELSSSRSFFALCPSQGYDSKWGEYELLFAWGAKAVFDTDALKNGALGGKISGAGGGGFMYFLCEPELQNNFIKKMEKLQHIDCSLSSKGSEIIYEKRN